MDAREPTATAPDLANAAVESELLPDPSEAEDLGRAAREYVGVVRRDLRAMHDSGARGTDVVEKFTSAIDRLIEWLFAAGTARYRRRYVQLDQRCAVIAQGGYGRGELNPYSDIDLLFLHPHKVTPYAETITETILYTLWDTRLVVGHAVRNVRDCVRIAGQDLKAKTALIDTRFICGDRELGLEFERALEREILPRATTRFFREKLRESETRHHQYGDSVYLLEPQIKEGQGGLRDLHTALWIAKVKFKVGSLRELGVRGLMNSQELAAIEAARSFLFRVRNSLHFIAGSHQDQLTFEVQEVVAANLGYETEEGSGLKPVEHFLRDYYLHASTVTRFADSIIDRAVNPPGTVRLLGRMMARTIRPGVRIVAGELTVTHASLLADDPIEILRLFVDFQLHGVRFGTALSDEIRSNAWRIGEKERLDPRTVEAFLAILRRSYRVYETLHEMHKLGVLAQIIPEWAHLLCLALHDFYHIYTVDEHSLMGVRELEKLRSGERAEALPLLTEVMREVDKVELLFLGMMLHDSGKGLGGGHSEKGAVFARNIAGRLGLNEDDTQELEFLVRQHLVLSHAAQRRDIHDHKLVNEIARLVGSPDTLKRLYLLTYADMRATGPQVWNNWKDMLLADAYMQVQEAFVRGFEPEDRSARISRIRERVLATVRTNRPADVGEVERFLDTMPGTYFLTTPESLLGDHAELMRRARMDGRATSVVHYPEREFSELTVAMPDRPGLFATLTGVLAASGMNIVGARIATSSDHMALDAFRVSHLERREIVLDDERWSRVLQLLSNVLDGKQSLAEALERVTRPGILDRPGRRPTGNPEVLVHNQTSDHYTVVDVHGHDRLGLLYGIASALFELGLEIHLAKISTNIDQVLDVFYVTEADGSKSERVEEIRERLLAVLKDDAAAPAAAAAPEAS